MRHAIKLAALLAASLILVVPSPATAGEGEGYFYEKGPVAIPDGHGAGVMKLRAELPNDIDPRVDDVNLTLRVKHPQTRDLVITLKRPNFDYPGMEEQPEERVVTLSDRDTRGKNLGRGSCPSGKPPDPKPTHTTFDDEAASPIGDGAPPYEGLFDPAEALSAFDGYHAAPAPEKEDWTLRIEDREPGKAGKLLCAGLYLHRV